MLVQVHQREGRAQPLVVLPDPSIANLGKSEDTLEDAKRMFHSGSNSGLGGVLALGFFIHIVLVFRPAASHILRLRRGCGNGLGLALIAAITPDRHKSTLPRISSCDFEGLSNIAQRRLNILELPLRFKEVLADSAGHSHKG